MGGDVAKHALSSIAEAGSHPPDLPVFFALLLLLGFVELAQSSLRLGVLLGQQRAVVVVRVPDYVVQEPGVRFRLVGGTSSNSG